MTYSRCSCNLEVFALSLEEGQLMVKLMLRSVEQSVLAREFSDLGFLVLCLLPTALEHYRNLRLFYCSGHRDKKQAQRMMLPHVCFSINCSGLGMNRIERKVQGLSHLHCSVMGFSIVCVCSWRCVPGGSVCRGPWAPMTCILAGPC